MSLLPHVPPHVTPFDLPQQLDPYWQRANDSLNFGNTACDIVNNEQKFGLELDVSQFRPEELKVHLDGKLLTIEGHHTQGDNSAFVERNFVRRWTLPDDVNLGAVHSSLTNQGHLCIDAPKNNFSA